ncbi:triose-phosphate isomerase [Erysipelothrix sp. HDW6C]|uniref:triose-phosphate isomerase n=1 Tax=Erysipelothrix sp. HDW6C TaxID=2714930 RepID=UPI0014075895|nr:triose-phosphate isomerase [Erysipelothrix sp. HDW6C]QIK69628.1 triose-phosphate isomerase [Erysipelothrix sp. HDW6C]
MRKPIIFGNWKMNKTNAQAQVFFDGVDAFANDKADYGVAVPFTALATSVNAAKNLHVAAENVHWAANGAYTGEISIEMLQEIGVKWVVLGHSERRQYFNETDADVNKKAAVAIEAGITPIVCVGETLFEFEADKTEEVVRKQVAGCLSGLKGDDVANLVIAYEPVWAIGTGKSATVEIAQNTCALVRDEVRNLFGGDVADKVRVQYGGSVKPDNIAEYMSQEDIDGALIGGASLEVDSFKAIIDAM